MKSKSWMEQIIEEFTDSDNRYCASVSSLKVAMAVIVINAHGAHLVSLMKPAKKK